MTFKLRPGMVLNFRSDNKFARTIQIGMGHYYSHTAWVRKVEGDKVYLQEALGSKTKKVTTSVYDLAYLEIVYMLNRLKVMDFGITPDMKFETYCTEIENQPYDYFAIFELGFTRLLTLLGFKSEGFFFKRFRLPFTKKDVTTPKMVDCSEAISRGIKELTSIDVLKTLSVQKFEQITPQLISVLYDKLKFERKIY